MSEINSTARYCNLSTFGFDGYRVGEDGSMWSCIKRVWTKGVRGCKSVVSDEWSQLETNEHDGYRRVTMRGKKVMVHDLVLLAFVGPAPDGMLCCHGNGIRSDNRLTNLRWGTPKENAEDMMRHGTHFRASGEANGEAELTEVEVLAIRARYAAGGVTQRQIAEERNVSQSTIWRAINSETWKHI